MLEDVVNSLITRFLGDYIKDIDKNDLRVSLWKGDLKFKNLEVKTEALDFLDLPVEIKSGYIGELVLKVPWKDIGRKPTKVLINQIFVVICPRSEVHYDEEAMERRAVEMKRQRLKAIEEKEMKRTKELNEKQDKSLVGTLINKIIRNFELSIDEIHIRYEDHSSDPKHPFCAGISLESISISPNRQAASADDSNSQSSSKPQINGVFSKDVLIHRFGVYWDSDNKSRVNTSNVLSLTEDMELAFHKPRNAEGRPVPQMYIIHQLSVEVTLDMDIRGVELRKPTPEEAAMHALRELGWSDQVFVNQKFVKTYAKIKKDEIRGRNEAEETSMFIAKFKEKYPKYCSSTNLQYAATFAALCWKYVNTAAPMVVAQGTLPQLTVAIDQRQIRDVAILLNNLTLQVRRAQQPVNRPEGSVIKHPRRWWKYAVNCVVQDNRRKRAATAWKDYLKFKKQRNEYITLYKRVLKAPGLPSISKDKKALERKQALEDIFSVENTILFRKMAQVEIEKDLQDSQSDSDSDNNEISVHTELYNDLEISEEDVNPWEGGQPMDILISVDFLLSSTLLTLKKEEQRFLEVGVDAVSVRAYKRKDFLELWAMVSDFRVVDKLTHKTRYPNILSVRHDLTTPNGNATPRDLSTDEPVESAVAESSLPLTTPTADGQPESIGEQRTRSRQSLLPQNLRGLVANPFVQAHVEIPALDHSSGMRVTASVQTLDIVLNVPWLLEVVKFLHPENIVVMSHYVEKAYNTVTQLREGDNSILAAVQNNRGMTLDVHLNPINLILPDSCTAHRSKTQLLLVQIGEVVVSAQPDGRTPDLEAIQEEDLYNTIHVNVNEVAVGFMDGRSFANRTVRPLAVLSDQPANALLQPFNVEVAMEMCLVNTLRYDSMKIGVSIAPMTINVTKPLLDAALAWVFPVLNVFTTKQQELDLNIMDLLLQPKQLLQSCIVYEGSPLFIDHDISEWKTQGTKRQKLLYRIVHRTQQAIEAAHPLHVSSDDNQGTSPINLGVSVIGRSMIGQSMIGQSMIGQPTSLSSLTRTMTISSADERHWEPTHGVMHLTYEDLLLLQYKPSMKIDLKLKQLAIVLNKADVPTEPLLAVKLGDLRMLYADHFYDMDIDLSVDSFAVEDFARKEQLLSLKPPVIRDSSSDVVVPTLVNASKQLGGEFLRLRFVTVGSLSMLNDFYETATNVFADLGPLHVQFNAAVVSQLLPLIPTLPPTPSVESASVEVSTSPPPPPPSTTIKEEGEKGHPAQQQEGLMSLRVTLHSLAVEVLHDDDSCLLALSMQDLKAVFNQTRSATHLLLSLQDMGMVDHTCGCGLYPDVLRIQHSTQQEPFIAADVILVNSSAGDLADTTLNVHISAPVLTVRFRFVQEIIQYTQVGSLGNLLHQLTASTAPSSAPVVSMDVSGEELTSPSSPSAITTSTSGIHSMLTTIVNNLFTSLVNSNLIRRITTETTTSYVLPQANVSLQNLVVILPATSTSREGLRFELGMFTIGNTLQDNYSDSHCALFSTEQTVAPTMLSMQLEGMRLLSEYMHEETLVSQSMLGGIDVSISILLRNVLSINARISPIVVTANQAQISFLLTRLLQNFKEEACTHRPAVKTSSSPLSSAIHPINLTEEKVKEEVNSVSSSSLPPPTTTTTESLAICKSFFVDVTLDGIFIELLKNAGGYTGEVAGKQLAKVCGTSTDSVFVLRLNTFGVNCMLTEKDLEVNLALASLTLQDSRPDTGLLPLFTMPVVIGDSRTPALTVLCKTAEEEGTLAMLHVNVALKAIRVFPAPLFMEIVKLLPEFLSVLPTTTVELNPDNIQSEEENEEITDELLAQIPTFPALPGEVDPDMDIAVAIDGGSDHDNGNDNDDDNDDDDMAAKDTIKMSTPSSTAAPSSMVGALLALVRLHVTIDPITLYLASSFTQSAPLMMVNLGAYAILTFTETMNIALAMRLEDVRITQCALDNLLPLHDYNDLLQSWSVTLAVDVQNQFKSINVSVTDEEGLNLSVGYKDVEVLLGFVNALLPSTAGTSTGTSTGSTDDDSKTTAASTALPAVKDNSDAPILPVVKLPLLVPSVEEGNPPLSVTATVSLRRLQVVVVSDVGDVEFPFVQLQVNDLEVNCDLSNTLILLLRLQLEAGFYNQPHVAWEPLIDPWDLMVQLAQHHVSSEAIEEAFSQRSAPPAQTSCTIRAEKVMTANVSTAFCTAALQLLNNLQKYTTQKQSDSQTSSSSSSSSSLILPSPPADPIRNGYYLYVENCLGVDATFEVIYDGGLASRLKEISTRWEKLDSQQSDLRCRGPLYVRCDEEDHVQLAWVEVFFSEPAVRVFSSEVSPLDLHTPDIGVSTPSLLLFQANLESLQVESHGSILFSCKDTFSGKTLVFFAAAPTEESRWREALTGQQPARTAVITNDDVLAIPAGALVRSALPANPSLSVHHSVESYNQRIVSIGVEKCRPIQFCCDSEGKTLYPIVSEDGTHAYDIIVHITSYAGLRVIQLQSLITFQQFSLTPVYCRFQSEELSSNPSSSSMTPSQNQQPTIYQSQRKQTTLEDIHTNYFGMPVGSKSSQFDSHAPGVAIRHPSLDIAKEPFAVGFGESTFCPLSVSVSTGRMELIAHDPTPGKTCVHNSIALEDITSHNLRRLCVNVGSMESPRYILMRVKHTDYHSERRDATAFTIVAVPVLMLKNILPMPLEFRVLHRTSFSSSIVQTGTVESGKTVELTSVNGRESDQFCVVVRPVNNQFVWGNQAIPIVPEGKGDYDLTDLENSHTQVQYQYNTVRKGTDSLSETLQLSIFCPYWVVNRTNETLFIGDKNDSSAIRLSPANIDVSFTASLQPTDLPLQPILFSAGGRNKKTVLRLRKANSPWSDKITLTKQACESVRIPAVAPFSRLDSYYSVSVKPVMEPFSQTRLLVISPRYLFVNKTNHDLILWHQREHFTLPALSCQTQVDFLPAPQRLLTISSDEASLRSAAFDCDNQQQVDLVLPGEKTELLSVTTRPLGDLQSIVIDHLKSENISYCVSNNSTLDCISVLQSSCDRSAALTILPLSSHMLVLPNPVGIRQLVLFLHQITEEENASAFQPVVLVDLEKTGVVTTLHRMNPDRDVEIVVEAEDATKIIIVRDKLPQAETQTAAWEQKKHRAFMHSVMEETLSKTVFAYNDTVQESDQFIAALQDFETHAEGQSRGVDLLLHDDYYWVKVRNASIRNLQRRPCSVTVRVSDGESLASTATVKGSHVYLDKEILLRRYNNAFQMKVIVAFEKSSVEFDVSVPFDQHSDFHKMELLELPFGKTTDPANSLPSANPQGTREELCDGGTLYLFIAHCRNNKLTNSQREYLPRLLYHRYEMEHRLQNLYLALHNLEYEQQVAGFSVKQAHSHAMHELTKQLRTESGESMAHVGNAHIQRALHGGDYANAPLQVVTPIACIVHDVQRLENQEAEHEDDEVDVRNTAGQLQETEEEKQTREVAERQIAELEREKLFAVELRQIVNLPTEVDNENVTDLQAVVCLEDGREFPLGHALSGRKAAEYESKPLELTFTENRIGCSFASQADGRVVVTRVLQGSEAARQGVCPGMMLWGICGKVVQGTVEMVKKSVKTLPRPLQLTFMAPYRNPISHYQDITWTGRMVLPAESTIGQHALSLEIRRGTTSLVHCPLKIRRFADWEGVIGDCSSPVTGVELTTSWLSRSAASMQVDTSITVSLAGIDVSLVDGVPREVINLGLRGLSLSLATTTHDRQSIDLSLSTLQIDNQLLNALEPVLLGRIKSDNQPTLQLSVAIPCHSLVCYVEYLRVQLQDLFLALDNRLLVALVQLLNYIPLDLLAAAQATSLLDMPDFQPILRVPSTRQASLRVFAENLTVDDIALTFSNRIDPASTTTGVFLPALPALVPVQTLLDTLLGLVADIDKTTLRLTSLTLSNFFGVVDELVNSLVRHYVPQATRQALKILGSINLLGNPVGLVEDVSSGIKALGESGTDHRLEEGGKELVRSTARGLFNTASKITGTLGNGIASLSFSKQYKEQRGVGRSGILHGLTSGVTGIIMDPIRGAKRNGVRGALEGVGTGLAGAVAKPISGLMDDTTKLLDTAKAATGAEEKHERLRLPRCILCDGVVRTFDEHTAQGQMLYTTAKARFSVEQDPGEQYVFHCCVDSNAHYLMVTQSHVLLLEPNCDLLWCVRLAGLTVEVDEEEMRVVVGKQSRLLLFNDKEICLRLYGILINIPGWTAKEIVQCSKDLVNYITTRHQTQTEVDRAYSRPAIDFRSLDLQSVCVISVDVRYERKMAGNYCVKTNAYQEYCLEVIGGVEGVPMASWRIYRRYSELRTLHKSIERALPKELKSVKFPGKKMQILGAHLNSKAIHEREEQMVAYVNDCLSKDQVLVMGEVRQFLCANPVNVHYEV